MAESYLQHAEHYQRIINSWAADVREQPSRREKAEKMVEEKSEANDDLSLPSSILGGEAKEDSKARTDEVVAG